MRAVVAAVLVAPQFLYHFEVGGQDSGTAGRQEARAVRSGGSARLLAVGVVAGQRVAGCRCGGPAVHARAGAGAGRADAEGSPRARRDQRLLRAVVRRERAGAREQGRAAVSPVHARAARRRCGKRRSASSTTSSGRPTASWPRCSRRPTRSSTPAWPPCTAFPRPSGQGFQRVSLNPAERAGIVTQASLLTGFSPAIETSPFKRGAWVRTRILCQELPVPPNEVPPLPELKAGHVQPSARRAAHERCSLQLLPQADRWPGFRLRAVRRHRSGAHHGSRAAGGFERRGDRHAATSTASSTVARSWPSCSREANRCVTARRPSGCATPWLGPRPRRTLARSSSSSARSRRRAAT